MGVALEIDVPFVVAAIDGAADDVDVGFVVVVFFFGVFVFRGILLFVGLVEVLLRGGAGKGDVLAIRRPEGTRRSLGQIGDDAGFAAGEREQGKLAGPGFTGVVLVAAANESQLAAIGRPARLRVVLAVGQANRSVFAARGDDPDRGLVAGAFFVHVDAGEGSAAAVRRSEEHTSELQS